MIYQTVEIFPPFGEQDKRRRLAEILRQKPANHSSKIIIFSETKRGADELTRALRYEGFSALAIHGDKSQQERDWVY